MKKIICVLLALLLCLCFCACQKDGVNKDGDENGGDDKVTEEGTGTEESTDTDEGTDGSGLIIEDDNSSGDGYAEDIDWGDLG